MPPQRHRRHAKRTGARIRVTARALSRAQEGATTELSNRRSVQHKTLVPAYHLGDETGIWSDCDNSNPAGDTGLRYCFLHVLSCLEMFFTGKQDRILKYSSPRIKHGVFQRNHLVISVLYPPPAIGGDPLLFLYNRKDRFHFRLSDFRRFRIEVDGPEHVVKPLPLRR